MNDRYIISFTEGGVGAIETIMTAGLAKITEKALDELTGDDNHGWYCHITDTKTNLKVSAWGATKEKAQENAFESLKEEIENYEYEQKKELERERERQKEKERERQRLIEQKRREAAQDGTLSHKDKDDEVTSMIKLGLGLMAVAIVLYIAFVILIIAILLSPLALLIIYLFDKRENKYWAIAAIATSAYLFYDFTTYGFLADFLSSNNEREVMKFIGLGYFTIFIASIGFYFEKYSSTKIPVVENGNFFTKKDIKKRRPLIIGAGLVAILFFSIFDFVNFSNTGLTNDYNEEEHIIINENIDNNSPVKNDEINSEENTNFNSNNNTISTTSAKGEIAVISDADGFTNLREGKGTNYRVVKKIYSNEKFTVYPSSEKWWKVRTNDGTVGYIFHNRVDLLNREFYIINVTATKTETQALAEERKLKNKGYKAGHLWIPNYKSLSGAKLYSVYIGPFSTQKECENAVEKYRKINKNAYGLLVSQKNKRVEIRGINKIKVIQNYKNDNEKPGLYPQASERLLTSDELQNMSKRDLKIMRNEIFARYGHAFIPGGEMERYFNNQKWYKNKHIDATKLLTDIEKQNIKLIKKYE